MQVIKAAVYVKAHVVTIDEKEQGLRGLLNFGHTIGHAYEAILAPEILHGECVAIGMIKEAEVSRNLGYLPDVCIGRLVKCLKSYGLPTTITDPKISHFTRKECDVGRLMDIMRTDKKTLGNQKKVVLLSMIGGTYEEKASNVSDDVIRLIISPSVKVASPGRIAESFSMSVPGSKSISNRALVLSALGEGSCRLKGLLCSDDVEVMLTGLEKISGICYDWVDNGDVLVIQGAAGILSSNASELYLGNLIYILSHLRKCW